MDTSLQMLEQVVQARAEHRCLTIRGGGNKAAYVRKPEPQAHVLDTTAHHGIETYVPEELVVTVRCGTSMQALTQALRERGQQLCFDAPRFGSTDTVGGTVASGLSGPNRPWGGAVRDTVLGVQLINGLGERLNFGGQVVKNVAGFDLSRLCTGSWGIFGVLLQVSLRTEPVPEETRCYQAEMSARDAVATMRRLHQQPLPLSGLAYFNKQLHWRYAGNAAAVEAAAQSFSGQPVDPAVWNDLRDMTEPRTWSSAWRRHVRPAAAPGDGDRVIDWAGALRWQSALDDTEAGDTHQLGESPFDNHVSALTSNLKHAFDPDNVFNTHLAHAN